MTDAVELKVEGSVGTVTVGSGTRRNALSTSDWHRLGDTVRGLADVDTVSVVVVRGHGGTFCAGSDLREWADASSAEVDTSFGAMEAALGALEALDVATVAAIEGTAAGARCQLALACDLRVLTRSARMGMPILRLGLLPSPMFALRIAVLTGQERARQLFYTGELLSAEKAQQWGLASEVVEDDELEDRLAELVSAVVAQPRSGIVGAKVACRVAADRQRPRFAHPEWRYSDPVELPSRMRAFLNVQQRGRATT